MIKSIFITACTIIIASILLLYEVRSYYGESNLTKLQSQIKNLIKEEPFLSLDIKIKEFSKLETNLNNNTNHSVESFYELGKINLLKGIKSLSSEDKLNFYCAARENFKKALEKNPRSIEYNLALADLESISPYLVNTCDSNFGLKLNQPSVKERLLWIEHLAPYDPPTLYNKGLIEKTQGDRIAAMKSFKVFDEKSLKNQGNIRQYLIQEVKNNEELSLVIPEKYPNTVLWYTDYQIYGNKQLNYLNIFENKLILMLNALERDYDSKNISSDELVKILVNLRYLNNLDKLSEFQDNLHSLLFKHTTLLGNNYFEPAFYKKILGLKNSQFAIGSTFSSVTKKGGIISSWNISSSQKIKNLNLKTEALGIYLPKIKDNNVLVIQGQRNSMLPPDLQIELWKSRDNQEYSMIEPLEKKFTVGKISQEPIAYINLGKLASGYYKIYFGYSGDKTFTISQPIDRLIKVYN